MSEHIYGIRTDQLSEKQKAEVERLIGDMKPEAEEMMASKPIVSTTQNDYGWYMAMLGPLKEDELALVFFINALLRAGANREGIIAAMRLI